MMYYILLFVAIANPAYLGTYSTEQECKGAIRQIYITRMVPPAVQMNASFNEAIEMKLKYQQEFTCVPARK